MGNTIIRKNYDILDLTKFILSFFIVAIHCTLLPRVLYPWLRIAVPIFFIISSFLFFSKLKTVEEKDKSRALLTYIKRNLTLYLVWFIILIPFTVLERKEWFDNGIFEGILLSLRGLFLGSTFRASWFIMAGVVATTLVYLLRKVNNFVLLAVGCVLYGICCLCTCYATFTASSFLAPILDISNNVFGGIETSFIFAVIWIVIGKMFAENTFEISRLLAITGSILTGALVYCEYSISKRFFAQEGSSSCYIVLIPFCIFFFAFLISFDGATLKNARFFRNSSTLIYVTHCAILTCVNVVLKKFLGVNNSVLTFAATSVAAVLLSFVLIKLSNVKALKFLKILW